MKKLHLIMPMGGAGSRFTKKGFDLPKPLIKIKNKPFFYWSTQSIIKYMEVLSLTFVVLQEHIDKFEIDKEIKKYYPYADIIILPKVLNGAVLTCLNGVKNINDNNSLLFNDCDHLFKATRFYSFCNSGKIADGILLTFESNDPKYSFIKKGEKNKIIGTVEKDNVSDEAICGAYYFKNKSVFVENANEYLTSCNYSEYYISGVYNNMIKNNFHIESIKVDYHLAFGTPEEYSEAEKTNYWGDLT